MSLARKAINFDLSTNELKKRFKNTIEAYNQIKYFMLQNGFEHRQYSGYVSKEPMEDDDITVLTETLNEKFTWLKDCIQEFDVTDIGEQYSLNYIFKANKTLYKTKVFIASKEISQNKESKIVEMRDKKLAKINKQTPSKDIKR